MQDDTIFELYKPLRNHLRQFPLNESLGVIRAYAQNLQFNQPLSKDIQVDISFLRLNKVEKRIYEWELDILAKEIILNSPDLASKTLRHWQHFSSTVNKLKDLENNISIHFNSILGKNILLELYRISHRQFPWQRLPNQIWMTRYYKIFGQTDIDAIIQKIIGLTIKEIYILGMALTGVYLTYFALDYPPSLEIIGINKVKFDKFLNYFSTDIDTMKKDIKESQSYNQDYAYSLNPLRIKPLIRMFHNGKDSLICPIPTFLFKRFTKGLYYEIYKDSAFANPFGASFQKYIGEAIEKANTKNKYKIFPEAEYHIGKDRKDTIDWIVADSHCNLFIECKTKKLRAGAKIALINNTALNEDLDLMAGFIEQSYKTIIDYQQNHYPNLKNNSKPVFPIIVTLEEWFAYGDAIILELDKRVAIKLSTLGIDDSIMQQMPYSICSADDFEKIMQIIDSVGIKKVMDNKTIGEKRLWEFRQVVFNDFNQEFINTKSLFPNDFEEISPDFLSKLQYEEKT
ncbi:MAG: hypothetical protein AAB352_03190 [Patescibacteria group bacterium]